MHKMNFQYLLPVPQSVQIAEEGMRIDDCTAILLEAGSCMDNLLSAQRLKHGLNSATGFDIPISRTKSSNGCSDIVLRIDSSMENREAYRLHIGSDGITIDGASSAGLRYGVETLLQIAKQAGVDLPGVDIDDHPDFAVRGLYHDVTRGQVPTLETMKEIADLCVFYKINHLEFYIEHSFAFRSMTEIGAGMDGLRAEEILEMDRYCRERHIDFVPSISTFGHMYEILRTRSFHHLNEIDVDGGELPYSWVHRMQHYTLDANNPESVQLVEQMLDEFLPLFTSDYVNICCDETFDLGKGKNKGIEPSQLYIKHLLAVIDLVKKRGKRVMFWGDMVLEYKDLLDKLPSDAIVLNWDYSKEPSENKVESFANIGVEQYLCPGISAWASFTARITNAESNIRNMALYGKKYNVHGFLNTNWGDYGHINLLSASLHGIVMGASYGWNVDGTPQKDDFDAAFSVLTCGDRTGATGGLLRKLGDADPYRTWVVETRSLEELREMAKDEFFHFDMDTIRHNIEAAAKMKQDLEQIRCSACPNDRINYDEFIWSAAMVQATNRYLLLIFGENIDFDSLASEFERLYDQYALLWRRRNKESELFRIREAMLRVASNIRTASTKI